MNSEHYAENLFSASKNATVKASANGTTIDA